MLSKLKVIPEVLLTVTTNVGHYEAMDKTDRYIVWAEDSEGSSVEGDNRKTLQTVQGTIDYYTRNEEDENVEKIQEALKTACISFYLNSVQYENPDQGGSGFRMGLGGGIDGKNQLCRY